MVAAFDYCLHGKGGAAPSIDTAMHGLVDAAHVDHLHPDSGIAIATAADGEALTTEIFGDKVVWVPWRRPGFQLGLDIAEIKAAEPAGDRLHPRRPRHHGVGRHQRGGRGELAAGSSSTAAALHRRALAGPSRSAARSTGTPRCPRPSAAPRPPRSRRRSAAIASQDRPMVGHFTDSRGRARLPRLAPSTRGWPRSARQLPRPLPAHQGQAAGARPARVGDRSRSRSRGCGSCTRRTARTTRRYYDRNATPTVAGDPRRGPADRAGARRRHVQLRQGQADRPRRRRVLRQRDQRDARRRGPLDVRPDRRVGEVPHRVLGARGGQAPADAEAQAARDPHRARHRRRVRHRQGHRRQARRRGRRRRDRRPRPGRRRRPLPPRSDGPTSPSACQVDVTDDAPSRQRSTPPCSPSAASTSSSTTPACRCPSRCSRPPCRLGPAARRDGQGLVPGLAQGRGQGAHRAGAGRRHRLHLVEELGLRRPEQHRLLARPRPTRRTRCGCSPPSSASTASRSTASTPTASCRARASSPSGRGSRPSRSAVPSDTIRVDTVEHRTQVSPSSAARPRTWCAWSALVADPWPGEHRTECGRCRGLDERLRRRARQERALGR